MTTIAQLAENIREVLEEGAREAGERTGFIEREREFDGSSFAQTLVFGWLGNEAATLEELSQIAKVVGVEITRQGLDQRFTEKAADLMFEVLQRAVAKTVKAAPVEIDCLTAFEGVYLVDSSIIQLPDELLPVWRGSGGGQAGQDNAGVKITVRWNWQTGELEGPDLMDAYRHDQASDLATGSVEPDSLHIGDLGYFKLARFRELAEAKGYWLSRYKTRTTVTSMKGHKLDLPTFLYAQPTDFVEMPVYLGRQAALPCRLVARRLSADVAAARRDALAKEAKREGLRLSQDRWLLAEWLVLVTNIPHALLSADPLFTIYRVRWQIELLFKLWKSEGLLDEWRTANPWRILCEFYAKLVALLIQHWVLITATWHRPERSLVQACRVVHRLAWALAFTLSVDALFELFLTLICHCLQSGARISPQQARPPTFQRLQSALT